MMTGKVYKYLKAEVVVTWVGLMKVTKAPDEDFACAVLNGQRDTFVSFAESDEELFVEAFEFHKENLRKAFPRKDDDGSKKYAKCKTTGNLLHYSRTGKDKFWIKDTMTKRWFLSEPKDFEIIKIKFA